MNKAHIPPAIAIRGMLNHSFIDANFPIAWDRWAKIKKISPSWFSLTQQTSLLSGCIQDLKTLALTAGEKSVMDFYEKDR